MASSGSSKLEVNSFVTTFSPTKPTPTKRPLFRALPNFIPIHKPIIVKMIGIITGAPNPRMYLKISPISILFCLLLA